MRWVLLVAGLVCTSAFAADADFARDIAPIFAKRCQGCHGAAQQMSGLRLDVEDAAMKGGYSGPVIIPGKSGESRLIARVSSAKAGFMMPPMGERLTSEQVAVLKAWIDSGAKWPALQAKTGNNPSRSNHWSFQPVNRPALPDVRNRAWIRNLIDAFVLARLEAEHIEPSPEAQKTTLIRRASLDLTGLPPSAAEVDEFVSDNRPDAYERLVERLLASPHYGEKWARQWLDLARYADSDGYEKDLVRPYAWRYRNWVIDALNKNMPFDEFTIEQIAGDLLPNATVEQRVATGFHRNTLTNREAGVDRAEARFEQTVNRANTIGTVWLGLTVGCAQCHNHKFDPISQKEYYQLVAFVNNVEEADIDAPLPGEIGGYLRARPAYDRERNEILNQYGISELQTIWESKMREAMAKPGVNLEWDFAVTAYRASVDNASKLIATDPATRTIRQQETLSNYFLHNTGPDFEREKAHANCLKEARARMDELNASFTPLTQAMTVVEDAHPAPAHIALGGDYRAPGVEVQPGTLAVLPALKQQGRVDRVALARWIASRENPLTARVAVNRMWQEFFGQGLVRTSDDFGNQGDKPTNPELLDWMAAEFMSNGWDVKQMHKTIVMSATYRQSSHVRKELLTRDPDNSLLARQSRLRLPAELIRDEALLASGLLNTAIGGRSVRPPQPAGVAELGYSNNVKWKESTGPERYRRGLYIHFQRTTPYPQLTNFDAPDSNVACTRRTRSNTPLQALNLLNDPVFLEAAQALAERTLKEGHGGTGEKLEYAFETCLSRKPTPAERERLSRYFDQQIGILKSDARAAFELLPVVPEGVDRTEAAAWVGISRVLLNLDEFITRE
jgi:mono/diheme cytochrome c family protein